MDIGAIIAIVGIALAVVLVVLTERILPKKRFRRKLWGLAKESADIKSLEEFSSDKGFTLALVSYLQYAKQAVWFFTPAPDALPSLQDPPHKRGGRDAKEESVTASRVIKDFWDNWLEEYRGHDETLKGRGAEIQNIVAKRVAQGDRLTAFLATRGRAGRIIYLIVHPRVWLSFPRLFYFGRTIKELMQVGKQEVKVKEFSKEYAKYLVGWWVKGHIARDYLLYLMNKKAQSKIESEKRTDDEEEALADLMLCLYWKDDYRMLFEKISAPWSSGLHDLTKYARIPLKVVKGSELKTDKRLIRGENIDLFSTGGGAWLLDYTVNYLEIEAKGEKHHSLITENHLVDELTAEDLRKPRKEIEEIFADRDYGGFWKRLDEINYGDGDPLFAFFEHPFQDRVLWEIVRGENLRYPAEMLANWKAFSKRYEAQGRVRLVWYREPFYFVGHMQDLGDERFKSKTDFYYQVYPSFGRTRMSSRFIASGPGAWENRGIIYEIFGRFFSFDNDGSSQEKIVDAEPITGRNLQHRIEVYLQHASNLQVDSIEAFRRQITIHRLLEDAKQGRVPSLSDFLRLSWFPYYDFMKTGKPPGSYIVEARDIEFADPVTWKGTGLLRLFTHETMLAYKILASLKILEQWFLKGPRELHQEKSPSLEDSISLIEDFLREEYIEEMEKLCQFLDQAIKNFRFDELDSETCNSFKKAKESIRKNIEKMRNVMSPNWAEYRV